MIIETCWKNAADPSDPIRPVYQISVHQGIFQDGSHRIDVVLSAWPLGGILSTILSWPWDHYFCSTIGRLWSTILSSIEPILDHYFCSTRHGVWNHILARLMSHCLGIMPLARHHLELCKTHKFITKPRSAAAQGSAGKSTATVPSQLSAIRRAFRHYPPLMFLVVTQKEPNPIDNSQQTTGLTTLDEGWMPPHSNPKKVAQL